MPIFAATMLSVGFAASMAFSPSMLSVIRSGVAMEGGNSFSDGAPNAFISPAVHGYPNALPNDASELLSLNPNGLNELAHPNIVIGKSVTRLDLWLEKLIILESNGRNDIKILDHNGEHSFGCLQFQKGTFEEFGMRYRLIAVDDDTDKLIYNCNLQKQIAKKMIEENYGNWKHWYTSVKIKKLGLPPKDDVEKITVAEAKL